MNISKTFRFESSHFLAGHPSACRNLHGHSYVLTVEVRDNKDNNKDMVTDFANLKQVVNKIIVDPIDHAYIAKKVNITAEESIILEAVQRCNMKIFYMEGRPTAENMAKTFASKLANDSDFKALGIELVSIRLKETHSSEVTHSLNKEVNE